MDRVSFTIEYGGIFGFLGANGAGKSTTIRMLCGILAPTSGTGTVAGFDVVRDPERVKESIGYVSQRFSLYTDLTVEENLKFYGNIYQLRGRDMEKRMREIYDLTGLGAYQSRMAGDLSGGWKQRLAVANGILHRPRILFLDEPTAGVDPVSRRALWELLYELAANGTALFVTTHYMEEAERCNEIAFISRGKLLRIGKPADLKAGVEGSVLEIECRPLMKASKVFGTLPGVIEVTAFGTTLHVNTAQEESFRHRMKETAAREGIEVSAVRVIPASLEDVFAALTEEVHGAD